MNMQSACLGKRVITKGDYHYTFTVLDQDLIFMSSNYLLHEVQVN